MNIWTGRHDALKASALLELLYQWKGSLSDRDTERDSHGDKHDRDRQTRHTECNSTVWAVITAEGIIAKQTETDTETDTTHWMHQHCLGCYYGWKDHCETDRDRQTWHTECNSTVWAVITAEGIIVKQTETDRHDTLNATALSGLLLRLKGSLWNRQRQTLRQTWHTECNSTVWAGGVAERVRQTDRQTDRQENDLLRASALSGLIV